MEGVPCYYCSGWVEEHAGLQCSNCYGRCHFWCGTGLSNVSDRTVTTYLNDCVFKCALCLFAEKNSMITRVVTLNQLFNENKHASDFHPGAQIREVAADDPVETPEPGTPESVVPDVNGATDTDVQGDDTNDREDPPPVLRLRGPPSETNDREGQPPVLRLRDGPPPGQTPDVLRLRDGPTPGQSSGYQTKVSYNERRRISRCNHMLSSLQNLNSATDTLFILDSNGKGISGGSLGDRERISVRGIGGLCVSATTASLRECTSCYPDIKTLVFGLGVNDHLHAREHPGLMVDYLQDLDSVAKIVFPNARIQFILPFSAIKGIGPEYVRDLGRAITKSRVGWKQHTPPSMKGNLAPDNFLHLTESGKKTFTSWLRKVFNPSGPGDGNARPPPTSASQVSPSDPHSASSDNFAGPGRPSSVGGFGAFNLNMLAAGAGAGESLYTRHSASQLIDSLIRQRLLELVSEPSVSTKHFSFRPAWPP